MKYFFWSFIIFFTITISAQDLGNNPMVVQYRKNFGNIDSLMQRGILTDSAPGLQFYSGYAYKTLYDWDQYFDAIVQIYMGCPSKYIKDGVLIFLDNEKPNGFIARSVPADNWDDKEQAKPFLAQISYLVYKTYGEKNWILKEPYFTKLKKYIDYWLYSIAV